MRSWGATIVEQTRTLPGDELVPRAGVQITQAVTVATPLGEVHPLLAQIGQDRGGFYGYEHRGALGPACRGTLLAEPAGDLASRLIARTRIPAGLASLAYATVEVPHFVMQRRLLLGIKARAEAGARRHRRRKGAQGASAPRIQVEAGAITPSGPSNSASASRRSRTIFGRISSTRSPQSRSTSPAGPSARQNSTA
jgi:hypothetical protein